MFNLRRMFVFWATIALCLGLAQGAGAQSVTVTVPPQGVKRDHQDGAGKVPLTQINYRDCLDEDVVNFTVNLGVGYNNYVFEAWAGESCDMQPNRAVGTSAATCWRVFSGQPNNLIYSFQVKVRDILSGRTGGNGATAGTGGSGGDGSGGASASGGADTSGGGDASGGTDASGGADASGGSANVPADAPSACIATSSATSVQNVAVFFLLLNNTTAVGSAVWKATYKLTAPAPPDEVTSGTGENIAPIRWSYKTQTADTTINGYQFYCDPAPGRAGALEAGVLPEPGSEVLPTECLPSTVLKAGSRPDDKYKCGTADKTSSRGNATGLVNNVAYNVAVATTDTYRNIGVISTPACGIPQPVTGFFEAYRNAGGEGGGGFCSISRRREPLIFGTLLGLAACLALRRRRAK